MAVVTGVVSNIMLLKPTWVQLGRAENVEMHMLREIELCSLS